MMKRSIIDRVFSFLETEYELEEHQRAYLNTLRRSLNEVTSENLKNEFAD